KKLDELFIQDTGISSFVLMESAANAFCTWFTDQFDTDLEVAVFCGTGNNGGDGLAISRLLFEKGYPVNVFIVGDITKASIDFKKNLDILPEKLFVETGDTFRLDSLKAGIFIDAVFGVGINRPLDGIFLHLIQRLNQMNGMKISIDIPSGLPSDKASDGETFMADHTVSFQFPNLSLLFPENAGYTD